MSAPSPVAGALCRASYQGAPEPLLNQAEGEPLSVATRLAPGGWHDDGRAQGVATKARTDSCDSWNSAAKITLRGKQGRLEIAAAGGAGRRSARRRGRAAASIARSAPCQARSRQEADLADCPIALDSGHCWRSGTTAPPDDPGSSYAGGRGRYPTGVWVRSRGGLGCCWVAAGRRRGLGIPVGPNRRPAELDVQAGRRRRRPR
jgi:hypothetical protein